jgi:acyl carrier protein
MTELSDVAIDAGIPPSLVEEVLATVTGLIVEVLGDEFLLENPITMDTAFDEDLELESIEFVALSEQIELRYSEGIDFVAWMGEMEVEEIKALRVGDLVTFIATNLG